MQYWSVNGEKNTLIVSPTEGLDPLPKKVYPEYNT